MDLLICEHAYRKNNDRRGKIMCKKSGILCAHQYYCGLSMKFKQTDGAKTCPGREDNGKND